MRIVSQYRAVLEDSRARLIRLTERVALGPLRTLYDEALKEIERKMARVGKGTMSGAQLMIMRMQAKQGVVELSRRINGQLADASLTAQTEGIRSTARDIQRLEESFSGAAIPMPIEEAARFRGIIDKSRTSLLKAHASSMARYGAQTITAVENELSLGVAAGENGHELTGRIAEAIDGERWVAERIARSESSWAFSASAVDAAKSATEELPDLLMRWTEYISEDGVGLDSRVGVDSFSMHQQLAKPGELYYMPPRTPSGEDVPAGLVGGSWAHPPCRPNGREVLSSFRPHWGIKGWHWNGSRRVPVTK